MRRLIIEGKCGHVVLIRFRPGFCPQLICLAVAHYDFLNCLEILLNELFFHLSLILLHIITSDVSTRAWLYFIFLRELLLETKAVKVNDKIYMLLCPLSLCEQSSLNDSASDMRWSESQNFLFSRVEPNQSLTEITRVSLVPWFLRSCKGLRSNIDLNACVSPFVLPHRVIACYWLVDPHVEERK